MVRLSYSLLAAAAVVVVACFPADAADVEKKFRLSLSGGVLNNQDEIASDSANQLTLFNQFFEFEEVYVDPRDDSSAFGALEIQPGAVVTLQGQYAITKVFIVEVALGYQKADVGQIEVQVQFDGVLIDPDLSFDFSTFRIPAGELERIPLQISGIARFRPRASFNPYIGAGIGYSFIGFEPSPEFDTLSQRMDGSLGELWRVTSAAFGAPTLGPTTDEPTDLQGGSVDARDTFEWHLIGGAEYSFNRKWTTFLDVRHTVSSRTMTIGFNGGQDLGIAVPDFTDFIETEGVLQNFGPMRITVGGLFDGGSLVPAVGEDVDTNCDLTPIRCTFEKGLLDGELDTGFHYAQGGELKYDAFSFQFGVRYTF